MLICKICVEFVVVCNGLVYQHRTNPNYQDLWQILHIVLSLMSINPCPIFPLVLHPCLSSSLFTFTLKPPHTWTMYGKATTFWCPLATLLSDNGKCHPKVPSLATDTQPYNLHDLTIINSFALCLCNATHRHSSSTQLPVKPQASLLCFALLLKS